MLWQAMVTHHDFQPRQHTMVRTRRKTNWNYNRDMIIDKPRENMNKNYEYYLQLDRTVCQISLCIIMHSATHPPLLSPTSRRQVPSVLWCTIILFSYRSKKLTSTSAMLWMGLAIAVCCVICWLGGRGIGCLVAVICSNILAHVLSPREGDAKT